MSARSGSSSLQASALLSHLRSIPCIQASCSRCANPDWNGVRNAYSAYYPHLGLWFRWLSHGTWNRLLRRRWAIARPRDRAHPLALACHLTVPLYEPLVGRLPDPGKAFRPRSPFARSFRYSPTRQPLRYVRLHNPDEIEIDGISSSVYRPFLGVKAL